MSGGILSWLFGNKDSQAPAQPSQLDPGALSAIFSGGNVDPNIVMSLTQKLAGVQPDTGGLFIKNPAWRQKLADIGAGILQTGSATRGLGAGVRAYNQDQTQSQDQANRLLMSFLRANAAARQQNIQNANTEADNKRADQQLEINRKQVDSLSSARENNLALREAMLQQKLDLMNMKPAPTPLLKDLTDNATSVGQLNGLLTTFKDQYGGHTPGLAKVGNWVGRTFGDPNDNGTGETAHWWQEYDNWAQTARHALYGGALTDSEIKQWEKASINPAMDPPQIRKNLEYQNKIITAALARKQKAAIANGYRKDAIEAATGLDTASLPDTKIPLYSPDTPVPSASPVASPPTVQSQTKGAWSATQVK